MSDEHLRNLPVPFYSQRKNKYIFVGKYTKQQALDLGDNALEGKEYQVSMASNSCNITSVWIVLRYYGVPVSNPDVIMKSYFAHPLYFINHFEKCGVFEFNPYEKQFNKLKLTVPANWNESAKKVKYGSSGGTEDLNKDSTLNNPGCAPFTEIAGIEEYAKLSGVFNEDYLTVARYWERWRT